MNTIFNNTNKLIKTFSQEAHEFIQNQKEAQEEEDVCIHCENNKEIDCPDCSYTEWEMSEEYYERNK